MNIWSLLSIIPVIFATPVPLTPQNHKTSGPNYVSNVLTEPSTVAAQATVVPKYHELYERQAQAGDTLTLTKRTGIVIGCFAAAILIFIISGSQIVKRHRRRLFSRNAADNDHSTRLQRAERLMNIELERRPPRTSSTFAVPHGINSRNTYDNDLPPAIETIVAPPPTYQQAVNDKLIDASPQKAV
ncbi:unnamed protein product [Ambrosiozyma monospora]|uniref:Unnamed protein product n=1 Tax=Ambrosiozyma monospora TaxID=43982 RepID=A0ACB5SVJ5_AMBMO|nr:unnamed protein product [Ambrosiozyma monospora]